MTQTADDDGNAASHDNGATRQTDNLNQPQPRSSAASPRTAQTAEEDEILGGQDDASTRSKDTQSPLDPPSPASAPRTGDTPARAPARPSTPAPPVRPSWRPVSQGGSLAGVSEEAQGELRECPCLSQSRVDDNAPSVSWDGDINMVSPSPPRPRNRQTTLPFKPRPRLRPAGTAHALETWDKDDGITQNDFFSLARRGGTDIPPSHQESRSPQPDPGAQKDGPHDDSSGELACSCGSDQFIDGFFIARRAPASTYSSTLGQDAKNPFGVSRRFSITTTLGSRERYRSRFAF